MEGLIPYVFRAFKRKKAMRYYRFLSSGAATATQEEDGPRYSFFLPQAAEFKEEAFAGHRKHNSMEDFTIKPLSPPKERRFGRIRFIACFGGAVEHHQGAASSTHLFHKGVICTKVDANRDVPPQ